VHAANAAVKSARKRQTPLAAPLHFAGASGKEFNNTDPAALKETVIGVAMGRRQLQ